MTTLLNAHIKFYISWLNTNSLKNSFFRFKRFFFLVKCSPPLVYRALLRCRVRSIVSVYIYVVHLGDYLYCGTMRCESSGGEQRTLLCALGKCRGLVNQLFAVIYRSIGGCYQIRRSSCTLTIWRKVQGSWCYDPVRVLCLYFSLFGGIQWTKI